MEKDPVHDANIRDELMQITEELNRMTVEMILLSDMAEKTQEGQRGC